MAEWRNMTGEDSATQDMLLAMWAHPSPTNIEVNIYFYSRFKTTALGKSEPAIKAQEFGSRILKRKKHYPGTFLANFFRKKAC
jgi:hypothetical protein